MTGDQAAGVEPDQFGGSCLVCGQPGPFIRDERPTRESYSCEGCRASLRYQGQSLVLLQKYARHGAQTIAELVEEPEFRSLKIWEPGERGPFRPYLRQLPGYEVSSYWPDVSPGSRRSGVDPDGSAQEIGVRCEDLMALTYASGSFDLIITSDVFEHVRKPAVGFAEVHRVLNPAGAHVFTIPVSWPMRERTVSRVDVSGEEDVFLLEPAYHKEHLVYNDFGLDLLGELDAIGFQTELVRFESTSELASRAVTFCSVKRGDRAERTEPVEPLGRRIWRRVAARLP